MTPAFSKKLYNNYTENSLYTVNSFSPMTFVHGTLFPIYILYIIDIEILY